MPGFDDFSREEIGLAIDLLALSPNLLPSSISNLNSATSSCLSAPSTSLESLSDIASLELAPSAWRESNCLQNVAGSLLHPNLEEFNTNEKPSSVLNLSNCNNKENVKNNTVLKSDEELTSILLNPTAPDTLPSKYAAIYNRGGRVGIYTPAERLEILNRYRLKKERRTFNKTIRYDCRKNLADRRLRIKGRFVKTGSPEEVAYRNFIKEEN
jgi:hypothetical protein